MAFASSNESSPDTCQPVKIAVTGTAGSGKSQVCAILAAYGFATIDFDQLARKAVAPASKGLDKIRQRFGEAIINADGTLDRRSLRRLIIADSKARIALEQIVHPEIMRLLEQRTRRLAATGVQTVFVEVPLLFEAGLESHFDGVIVVRADPALQVDRLKTRDNVSDLDARNLLAVQIPDTEKARRADIVIDNTGTPDDLERAIIKRLSDLAKIGKFRQKRLTSKKA